MMKTRFRAWDGKEMQYVFKIRSIDGVVTKDNIERVDWIVMQFTGLFDKNGKGIYEGDIIKDGFDSVRSVFWEEDNARFHYGVYGLVQRAAKDYEVLGNIYENPELLK